MNLSEIKTRVADDGNVSINVVAVSSRITREINRVCEEVWRSRAWSFRWRTYRILTDIDVTSGTVTATNGSHTVTASATPFLSSHKTWHICFPEDSTLNWYQVRYFTSSSQIELDVPYQGTSGSGKTYILRHVDYVLPTEISDFQTATVTSGGVPLSIFEPSSMSLAAQTSYGTGGPSAISIFGSDSVPAVYSTGTVSGTINTQTLTGSGTAWLANVQPGDDIAIGSYTYRVRSVETDTSIILYNNLVVAPSASTYTATRQFGRIVRIFWSSTKRHTIEIHALRKYPTVLNDIDTNELFDRMPEVVIKRAASTELKQQNDRREMEMAAERALLNAKSEDDAQTPRQSRSPIYTYRSGFSGERMFR